MLYSGARNGAEQVQGEKFCLPVVLSKIQKVQQVMLNSSIADYRQPNLEVFVAECCRVLVMW